MIDDVKPLIADMFNGWGQIVQANRDIVDGNVKVGGIMKPLKGYLRKVDKTLGVKK